MSDLRFLLRRKTLTAVAVLAMAMAIGATAASLSVLRTFLLSGLGIPDADRVVLVQPERELPGRGLVKFNDSYPNYLLLREAARSLAEIGAVVQQSASWNVADEARQLDAARATATLAGAFGVRPVLGRWIEVAEEGPNPAPVAVISNRLWRGAFGGDPGVVGRTIALNGAAHTIIGVMPPGFDQPTPTDVWLPFDIPMNQRTAITGARQLVLYARLANGVSLETAERDMVAFTKRALEASADNRDFRHTITPLRKSLLAGADESATFVLAGAVGLMILAVLNLSSLLIAWGFERHREFAVRTALGAGQRQVVVLVLRQSLVVVTLAAVAGIALALAGLRFLQGFDFGPTITPFVREASLDWTVIAITIAFATIAGLAAGLLPAWYSRESSIATGLQASSRGSTLSRGAMAWQKGTVLCQSALSVMILAAAALVGYSFWRLASIPDGFVAQGKVVARVVLPDSRYPGHPQRAAFARALRENLAAQPAIARSGFTSTLPVSDVRWGSRFHVELPDGSTPAEPVLLHSRRVSPSYLGAMGIPILRGRDFTAADDTSALPAVIVSRALAERLWPGADAVGKRLVRAAAAGGQPVPHLVVGVAGNTMDGGYNADPGETVYVPYAQWSLPRLSIVVESRTTPAAAASAIREALRKTDPVVAAGNIATLEALVLQANSLPRLRAVILLVFAVVALAIVALGMYGVTSQLVSTREREFALRLIFGARPRQLGALVMTQVAAIAIPGVALGLVAGWMLSGTLRSFLFGIEPTSLGAMTLAGASLLALTAIAALPTAVRAMNVDVRSNTA